MSLMFALFATTAKAQTIAADSAVFKYLTDVYITQDLDHMICLVVHRDTKDSTKMVIDSTLGLYTKPPCPPNSNGLAGVAETGLTAEAADKISHILLNSFPEYILVCAISGIKYVKEEQKKYPVPILWCTKR